MAKTYEAIEKDTGKRFSIVFEKPKTYGVAKADKFEEYFHAYIEAHPEKGRIQGFQLYVNEDGKLYETQPDLPFEEFKKPNAREVPNVADIHGAFCSLLGISPKEYRLILERYVWGCFAGSPEILMVYNVWLKLYYTADEIYHVICAVNACMEDGFGEKSDRGRWKALAELTDHETWGALLFSIMLSNMDTEHAVSYMGNMYAINPEFVNPWNVHKVKCLQDTMKKRYERKNKDEIANNSAISAFLATVFARAETFSIQQEGGIVNVIGTHEAKRRAEGKTPKEGVLALMQNADANRNNIVDRKTPDGNCMSFYLDRKIHSLFAYCLEKVSQMYVPESDNKSAVTIEINLHEYAQYLKRSESSDALQELRDEVYNSLLALYLYNISITKHMDRDCDPLSRWTHIVYEFEEYNYPRRFKVILPYRIYECAKFRMPFIRDLLRFRDMYTFSIGMYITGMARNRKQMIDSVTVKTLMQRVGIEEEVYSGKQNRTRFFDQIQKSLNNLSGVGITYRLTEKKDGKRVPLSKPIKKYSVAEIKKLIIEFTSTSKDPDIPEKARGKKK